MSSQEVSLNESNKFEESKTEAQNRLAENVHSIRRKIKASCERSDRNPDEVRICAVTKNRPVEAIKALHKEGIQLIGENRVQEAERKYRFLPDDCRIHLIGHLQSNKTSLAVRLFDGIQSVDRAKIVEYLQRHCSKRDLTMPVFLQVNVSGESSKFGVAPEDVESVLEQIEQASSLTVKGLMTMAPYVDNPEEVRPIFAGLREIRDRCRGEFKSLSPGELSMGMTQDYQIAVEEGATLVRVGRGFFTDTEWE